MPGNALPKGVSHQPELRIGARVGDWEFIGNQTKPGDPLWDEWRNVKTGETTLKKHTPRKISSFDVCDHYWEVIDSLGNIQCRDCQLGKRIVWGKEIVKDGKIIRVKKS